MGSMRWRSKSSTPRKRTSSVPRSIPFDAKIHTEVIEYLHCLSIECRLILTYIFLLLTLRAFRKNVLSKEVESIESPKT